ncbi:NAD-dependent epimerase/dehydratase family protein [Afipia sp. TerB]
MRIFLAGALGVVGRPLSKLLTAHGHDVTGTTRSVQKEPELRKLGLTPSVVDVFDADRLTAALVAWRPDVVIHQLTDLPDVFDRTKADEVLGRNARLRIEGTRNLVAAARAAGARRIIAQSIAFAYEPGGEPHDETDPLAGVKSGTESVSVRGVMELESAVLNSGLEGIVLRYGRLYGPNTWTATAEGSAPLHVDAAAQAALLALDRGLSGIYNIAEDDGFVSTGKARRELGFDPAFRVTP